jgi:bacterioferritin-associated ferredoxin
LVDCRLFHLIKGLLCMYVCVCNAVTEDDVRGCVVAGACSTKEVRSACGMQPGCGSCTKRLRALVSENLISPPWLRPATPGPAVEPIDSITGGPARPLETAPGPLQAVPGGGQADPMVTTGTGDTVPVEHAA